MVSERIVPNAALVVFVAVLVGAGLAGCGRSDFVPYAPTAELVPPIDDQSGVQLGTPFPPRLVADCHGLDLWRLAEPGPNGSEWRAVTQLTNEPEPRSRIVWFATRRFETRQALADQVSEINDWFREPCSGSDVVGADGSRSDGSGSVERSALTGLPEGAVTAHWAAGDADVWSTVIPNRNQQTMMIAVWAEEPGAVPTDTFAATVNTAWSEFEARNS